MKKYTLWIVEDSKDFRETLVHAAEAVGLRVKEFEDCSLLGTATGNPDYLIIDVGSIGMIGLNEAKHYTSVLYAVRDKFPGSLIYLRSGIDTNAVDLAHEMHDPMIVPVTGPGTVIDLIERMAEE